MLQKHILHLSIKISVCEWLTAHILHDWKAAALQLISGDENDIES